MTRDDYYNMAVASGLWQSTPIYDTALMAIALMRFVKMVAAVEREACAKVCDDKVNSEYSTGKVDHNEIAWTYACADAIRARGEK